MTLPLAVLLALAFGPSPERPQPNVIRVHYTPRDQQAARYAYVPFDVPPGTTRLTISYAYDRADGTNVLDLGVFEPGPLDRGSPAYRGWSGGSLAAITIGEHEASPGYWPGPLPAGRWHVMLGLYKIAPTGVDATVRITLDRTQADSTTPRVPTRSTTPLRTGARWYSGVLHTHTTNSDGSLTPPELIAKARSERLDFLAITDHNNTVHQLTAADGGGVLIVSGEEVTTPGGHFNVWGLGGARDYVDFRIAAGDPALAAVMDAARARGAVVGINHPIDDCLACTWMHGVPAAVEAIEIGNGTEAARAQAMVMWDAMLRAGRRVTAVGGADWHRGTSPLGRPAELVWAEDLSVAAILGGIRAGRVVIVASATLAAPDVVFISGERSARVGDDLVVAPGDHVIVSVAAPGLAYSGARVDFVWNGETVDSRTIDGTGTTRFDRYPALPGHGRVHVTGRDGATLAITNPVFIRLR